MDAKAIDAVVAVAAGSIEEFSSFVFDQLVLLGENVMAYVPGADRVTISGVEHRYVHFLSDMDGATSFEFVGTWYLRQDSTAILARAQEIASV